MTAPVEDSVSPLAEKLVAYPEIWKLISAQVRQPHYLANFVATMQPGAIALFTYSDSKSPSPHGFLTGVLYFEIASALELYTMAMETLVDIFEREELPSRTGGGALLGPGAPLAVAHRVMAEPIEIGPYSPIALDFYAGVIAACIYQRRFAHWSWRTAVKVREWWRGLILRNIPSLEPHRMAWDPDDVDHIQALAHWQRAKHALAMGLSESAHADFANCASRAAAAQARSQTLEWPAECLAAARSADGAAAGAEVGDFAKAIGSYARSIPLLPWAYNIPRP